MSNTEDERKRRLAQSLRENLRRRKQQARAGSADAGSAQDAGSASAPRDPGGAE